MVLLKVHCKARIDHNVIKFSRVPDQMAIVYRCTDAEVKQKLTMKMYWRLWAWVRWYKRTFRFEKRFVPDDQHTYSISLCPSSNGSSVCIRIWGSMSQSLNGRQRLTLPIDIELRCNFLRGTWDDVLDNKPFTLQMQERSHSTWVGRMADLLMTTCHSTFSQIFARTNGTAQMSPIETGVIEITEPMQLVADGTNVQMVLKNVSYTFAIPVQIQTQGT